MIIFYKTSSTCLPASSFLWGNLKSQSWWKCHFQYSFVRCCFLFSLDKFLIAFEFFFNLCFAKFVTENWLFLETIFCRLTVMNIRAFAANMGFKGTPLSNGFQRDHWSQKSMFIKSGFLTESAFDEFWLLCSLWFFCPT